MSDGPHVGLTRDAGWEMGVQRSTSVEPAAVWAFLTSAEGLGIWLGSGATLAQSKGSRYAASDGVNGEVKSFREMDRIRLSWQPLGWERPSTVQVAIRPNATGTAIRFHQERLSGPGQRAEMLDHWTAVLERLIARLEA